MACPAPTPTLRRAEPPPWATDRRGETVSGLPRGSTLAGARKRRRPNPSDLRECWQRPQLPQLAGPAHPSKKAHHGRPLHSDGPLVSTRIEQVCYTEQVHLQTQPSSHQGDQPCRQTSNPQASPPIPKSRPSFRRQSLKDSSTNTNAGLDATESLSIEAVSWLDLADMSIDADTNGQGVDFYAIRA